MFSRCMWAAEGAASYILPRLLWKHGCNQCHEVEKSCWPPLGVQPMAVAQQQCLASGRQRSELGLVGLKSTCWQGCGPSGGSRGESVSLSFLASRDCPHALACGPCFPSSKPAMSAGSFSGSHLSDSPFLPFPPPSSPLKDPCGSTVSTWIIQDSLPISRSADQQPYLQEFPFHVTQHVHRFQGLRQGHL